MTHEDRRRRIKDWDELIGDDEIAPDEPIPVPFEDYRRLVELAEAADEATLEHDVLCLGDDRCCPEGRLMAAVEALRG